MNTIDIVLMLIIAGFALGGLWFGLFHTLGSLVGTVVGAYAASRYYEQMADVLMSITGWEGNLPKIIMFIIAFIIINRLVGFVFWIIDKILSIVTKLPFISSINKLLGLIFGVIEGVLTIGLIVYFIERFPLSEGIMEIIAQSQVAEYTSSIAAILIPLLPDALKLLESTVDYVGGKVL